MLQWALRHSQYLSQHALHTLLPRGQCQAKGVPELGGVEARVVRALRRGREGAGGHGVYGVDFEG